MENDCTYDTHCDTHDNFLRNLLVWYICESVLKWMLWKLGIFRIQNTFLNSFPYFVIVCVCPPFLHCILCVLSLSLSLGRMHYTLPRTAVSNDNIKHSTRLIIFGEQANRAKQHIYHFWQTIHLLLIKIYWIPICCFEPNWKTTK